MINRAMIPTVKMLSKVFKDMAERSAVKAEKFVKNIDSGEVIIGGVGFAGAVGGSAAARTFVGEHNYTKMGTVGKVLLHGSGAVGGGIIGAGAFIATIIAVSEAPVATTLTVFGAFAGSSIANKIAKSRLDAEDARTDIVRVTPSLTSFKDFPFETDKEKESTEISELFLGHGRLNK
jgi:hypothetical protein